MTTRKITYHGRRDKLILNHVTEKRAQHFFYMLFQISVHLVEILWPLGRIRHEVDEPIKRLLHFFKSSNKTWKLWRIA